MNSIHHSNRRHSSSFFSKAFHIFSPEVWLFLAVTALGLFILVRYVDLQPKVDNNFFFSSDDPQFKSEQLISRLFPRSDNQLIISATGSIKEDSYLKKIELFSQKLLQVPGITGVKSLSHGPGNFEEAQKSPLWKRIILSQDLKSTNLIVLLTDEQSGETVRSIEQIMAEFSGGDFTLNASGLPYVVELIRRNLVRDLTVFSLLAFIIFGTMVFVIFRSKSILFGTLITCTNACMWTFMVTQLLKVPVGLLTANLATIIFVLTLSHIVFMTFNWKNLLKENHDNAVAEAVRMTLAPSFWSMLTTFLGFASLFSVPAKPLKELGTAGLCGTAIAMFAAYGLYPAFLRLAHEHEKKSDANSKTERFFEALEKRKSYVRFGILVILLVSLPGVTKLNTDPSLISYFDQESDIARGLNYIDLNGGSSPLVIVVRTKSGEPLNSQEAYKGLWRLQETLEKHGAVGSIISLPVLMAEAKRAPLAFFLTWEWLLGILEQPQYDEIAKSFVTEDRRFGLFLLRMTENNRTTSRLDVIEKLDSLVRTQGFIPEIFGGVYALQGHLSKLVASSLVYGLLKLIGLFAAIAWIISRRFQITMAVTLSIILIPSCILGLIGLYDIPLDIISAPASNVAMAIGIDAMIHIVQAYRRRSKIQGISDSDRWRAVRHELWKPVLTSMTVIVTGFGIFLFSTFPPTQRFGGAIIFGSIIASLTALFIMPWLSHINISPVKRRATILRDKINGR